MTTDTVGTPEEKLQRWQERKVSGETHLHEVTVKRGDARHKLYNARALGVLSTEQIEDLRTEFDALDREHREIAGALEVIEAEIVALVPIVNEQETQRLVEVAAEKRAALREVASRLQPMVEAFAKEYAPVLEEARVARMAAVEAETAARRAQGMHPQDVSAARNDVGIATSGWLHIDQTLHAIAFPPPINPNLPEQIAARGGLDWAEWQALQAQNADAQEEAEGSS